MLTHLILVGCLLICSVSSQDRFSPPSGMTPIDMLMKAVPGTPGEDYPIFSQVPETSFSCKGKVEGGYYVDVEADCQPFHVCTRGGHHPNGGRLVPYSFLCPNGSLFNQQYFICDWWFNVDCSESESLYYLNDQLFTEDSELSSLNEVRSSGGRSSPSFDSGFESPKFTEREGPKESSRSRNGQDGAFSNTFGAQQVAPGGFSGQTSSNSRQFNREGNSRGEPNLRRISAKEFKSRKQLESDAEQPFSNQISFQTNKQNKNQFAKQSKQSRFQKKKKPNGQGSFRNQNKKTAAQQGSFSNQKKPTAQGSFSNQNQPTPPGSFRNQNKKTTAKQASFSNQKKPTAQGSFRNQNQPTPPGSFRNQNKKTTAQQGSFSNQKKPTAQGSFRNQNQPTPQGSFRNQNKKTTAQQGSFSNQKKTTAQGSFRNQNQPTHQESFRNQNKKTTAQQGSFSNQKKTTSRGSFRNQKQPTPQGSFFNQKQPTPQGSFRNQKQTTSQGSFINQNKKTTAQQGSFNDQKKTTFEGSFRNQKQPTAQVPFSNQKKSTAQGSFHNTKKTTAQQGSFHNQNKAVSGSTSFHNQNRHNQIGLTSNINKKHFSSHQSNKQTDFVSKSADNSRHNSGFGTSTPSSVQGFSRKTAPSQTDQNRFKVTTTKTFHQGGSASHFGSTNNGANRVYSFNNDNSFSTKASKSSSRSSNSFGHSFKTPGAIVKLPVNQFSNEFSREKEDFSEVEFLNSQNYPSFTTIVPSTNSGNNFKSSTGRFSFSQSKNKEKLSSQFFTNTVSSTSATKQPTIIQLNVTPKITFVQIKKISPPKVTPSPNSQKITTNAFSGGEFKSTSSSKDKSFKIFSKITDGSKVNEIASFSRGNTKTPLKSSSFDSSASKSSNFFQNGNQESSFVHKDQTKGSHSSGKTVTFGTGIRTFASGQKPRFSTQPSQQKSSSTTSSFQKGSTSQLTHLSLSSSPVPSSTPSLFSTSSGSRSTTRSPEETQRYRDELIPSRKSSPLISKFADPTFVPLFGEEKTKEEIQTPSQVYGVPLAEPLVIQQPESIEVPSLTYGVPLAEPIKIPSLTYGVPLGEPLSSIKVPSETYGLPSAEPIGINTLVDEPPPPPPVL